MIRAIRLYFSNLFLSKSERKVIYIQDPESGGFSAHFEDMPETVGQGKTRKEAYKSLLSTTQYVKELEEKERKERRKLQHA